MPKVCFFKNCKSISDRHTEKVFVPFVKPYTDIKRCKRWIQLCGRPSIPPEKIDRNYYICSDHFGPNEVLDWKKNAKLDPIPFHRLKKVTREEVFRHQNPNPNPHSVLFGRLVSTASNSNVVATFFSLYYFSGFATNFYFLSTECRNLGWGTLFAPLFVFDVL